MSKRLNTAGNWRRALALALMAGGGLGSIAALTAQEPRRLRNLPGRILERLQNDSSQKPQNGIPTSRNDAMSRAAARPQLPNVPPGASPQQPADPGAATQGMRPAQAASQAGPAAPVDPAASLQRPGAEPPDGSQPIVVATEAEKNQRIAEGWPEPWAALILTGHQHGYIEPCGCTGLENQKGGLNRRDTLIEQIRDRGWPVVPIDAGDQVRRYGPQAEIKYAHTVEALKMMDYAAVGFGPEELHLSSTPLLLSLTDLKGQFKSPFVSANVSVLTPEAPERFKIVELPKGKKIGVTAVLGDDYAADVPQGEITVEPAVAALKAVAVKIAAARCDRTVLIVHGSLDETRRIAQAVPGFDLVITAGGYGEPLYKPEPIPGTDSQMIQVGVKGMYAGLVGLYDDPAEPVRYQRLALSSQFEDSPRMMELFEDYQRKLKTVGFKDLGLNWLSHPSTREFVGSNECGNCHTTAFNVWKDTPHAHATDSLLHPPGREDIPRHFDPECLSCHVTGWNPQQYYPYKGGYASLDKTPDLVANGCENCHGPGSQHVAYENGELGEDEDLRQKLIAEMRLPLEEARNKCLECHDLDNSPDFHHDGAFEEYWSQVEHYGKD